MEKKKRDVSRYCECNGDAVEQAYQDGINTSGRIEFKKYATYAEDIAYRAGWLAVKKRQLEKIN